MNCSSSSTVIIVTGGPCTGKTSVIECLRKQGFAVIEEAAQRAIKQLQNDGIGKPYFEPYFEKHVVALQTQSYENATSQVVITDRSRVDCLAYCRKYGHEGQEEIKAAIEEAIQKGVYKHVFLAEDLGNWEENGVRYETPEERQETTQMIQKTYEEFGFKLIRLPKEPIEQRAQRIIDFLREENLLQENPSN